jgi:hypothetical protein
MASRYWFVLAVVVLGCTMDNPAFGLERDVGADESGDGDPTRPDSSSSSTTATTSSGDGDGDSSTTDGGCLAGTPCGPCHVCDDVGECVPDVGAVCEGSKIHCAEYLYGGEGGTCFTLPDVVLDSRCDMSGQCKTPTQQACPLESGGVHFACDPACVTNQQACAPFALAADVGMAAMCAVKGPGPDCHNTCSNDTSTVTHYTCNVGECVGLGIIELCEPYACNADGAFCYDSCQSDLQCAGLYSCIQGVCQPN